MKWLHQLETRLLRYVKDIPHLPANAQKWLGANIWWIVLIGVIISAISILFNFFEVMGRFAVLGTPASQYFIYGTGAVAYAAAITIVGMVFTVVSLLLTAFAIKPLQNREKRGWVLLFAVWLVYILNVIVSAIMTLNAFTFIFYLLFGTLVAAVIGYFLFEMHGQFGHAGKPVAKSEKNKPAAE